MREEKEVVESLGPLTGKADKKLLIIHIKGVTDSYLVGVRCLSRPSEVTIRYACMCSPMENNALQIIPAIIPTAMMAASFGKEAFTTLQTADALLITEVPLGKNSSHKFVQSFVEFWGPEVLE